MEIIVVITIWFALGVIGGLIGQQHGKTGKGFALGFLFGPIGWAMMLFDVSVTAVLVVFAGVVVIVYWFGVLIVQPMMDRSQKETERQDRARTKSFEASMTDAEEKSSQPAQIVKAATAPIPAATPRRTPTPQELVNQQVEENSRHALEILRKYGTQK